MMNVSICSNFFPTENEILGKLVFSLDAVFCIQLRYDSDAIAALPVDWPKQGEDWAMVWEGHQ